MNEKPPLRARLAAFLAGLKSAGVAQSDEDRAALENAEKAVAQDGDSVPLLSGLAFSGPHPLQKELEAQREQIAQIEAQLAAAREAETDALLMGYKRTGHLTPAAEEPARTLLAVAPMAFRAFVEANGPHVAFTQPEEAHSTLSDVEARVQLEGGGADAENTTLRDMALARLEKTGQSQSDFRAYAQALAEVARENPALVTAHRQAVPSL